MKSTEKTAKTKSKINIIKGLDRIALLISILSSILIFLLVAQFIEDEFRMKNPVYPIWQEKYGAQHDEYMQKLHKFEEEPTYIYKDGKFVTNVNKKLFPPESTVPSPPSVSIKRPFWQVVLGAVIITPFGCLVLFLSLRLLIRIGRWIVDGFKE